MPKVSNQNAERFAALRRMAADALTKINAARKKARQNGDTAREDELLVLREQVRNEMRQIDEAEDAFERSSMSESDAEAKLTDAVSKSKSVVAAMTNISTALEKAAELLKILRGLFVLFA